MTQIRQICAEMLIRDYQLNQRHLRAILSKADYLKTIGIQRYFQYLP